MRRTARREKTDRTLSRLVRSAGRAPGAFSKDGGFHLAAAISYYAIMSFIPMMFLMVQLLLYTIGRSPHLQEAVLNPVVSIYPMVGPTIKRELARITAYKGLDLVTVLIFLWLGSMVFESLEYSMNVIFKTRKKRRYLYAKLLAFGCVTMSGVFFSASFWAGYIPRFLRRHPGMLGDLPAVRFLTESVLVAATPFMLTFLSFTLLYKLLPRARVSFTQAGAGGLAAGILWEASKYLFTWFMGNVANISLYGSLSAMVFFMLWVYYSAIIMLLVAEALHIWVEGKIS